MASKNLLFPYKLALQWHYWTIVLTNQIILGYVGPIALIIFSVSIFSSKTFFLVKYPQSKIMAFEKHKSFV